MDYSVSKERVKDFINTVAIGEGVSVQLVESVAWAESRDDVNASNTDSSASGLFQFLNSTFKDNCVEKYKLVDSMKYKNDPQTQTLCAVKMIKDGNLSAWEASSSSWKPLVGES